MNQCNFKMPYRLNETELGSTEEVIVVGDFDGLDTQLCPLESLIPFSSNREAPDSPKT